jgi:hypothetical protein
VFEECYRQGVLTSEFFLDNKRFLGKISLKPDPKLRAAFFGAVKQAQDLAQLRLKTTPDDTNALFAMASAWVCRPTMPVLSISISSTA